MGRSIRLLAIALAVALWPTVPAGASWTGAGSGPSAGRAATLSAPTGLSASCSLLLSNSVRLSWSASPTAWLDGYEVRWGTSSGNYTTTVTVPAGQTSYDTPGLSAGTYYFAVRAKRATNWRSSHSNQVSKSIISILGLGLSCT